MRYEDRRELAVKAVNRLIADVEAKRLLQNKELAEVIAACILDGTRGIHLHSGFDSRNVNRRESP